MVGGYLVLSSLAYVAPHRPWGWPLLALLHVGLGSALLTGRIGALRHRLRQAGGSGPAAGARRAAALLLDGYPLVILPFLYWELELLNSAIWAGRGFDALVQGWEAAVFGGQPSVTLAHRWPSLLLSETLHLAYLSYYPILYVFPVVVYVLRGRQPFLDTLFGMMLGFAIHYLIYIVFPVKGPYYLLPPPGAPQSAGPMYQAVHFVLATGSSAGTAFPSSHVALSAVQATNAARHLRAAVPVLVICLLAIAVGAVYAGIHYAIDVVVGAATGLLVGAMVPAVRRRLE